MDYFVWILTSFVYMHIQMDQLQNYQKNMLNHGWVNKDIKFTYVGFLLSTPYLLDSSHDYTHSDYPVTLPLRRPYSGDPGILLVLPD